MIYKSPPGSLCTKIQALLECEQRLAKAPKQLELQLESDGGVLKSCCVSGTLGTVRMKSFETLGLPSDEYKLTVKVNNMAAPSVTVETHDGQFTESLSGLVAFKRDIKEVRVSLGNKAEVCFTAFEVDGHVHWLKDVGVHAANVESGLEALFAGDSVTLQSRDSAATMPWLTLEGKLMDLGNKLSRLADLKAQVTERYVPAHDDGWFELFGAPEDVDVSQSQLRLCLESDFCQRDLILGMRTVEDVEQCLAKLRNVRLESDVPTIVQQLHALDGQEKTPKEMKRLSERHTATLHALLDMRRELVDSVLIPTKEVVETRTKYLTMSAVDAGLRHVVSGLCNVDGEQECALRAMKLCRFQLGQIFANNERNERQLTKAGYDVALNVMEKVMERTSRKETWPNVKEGMPYNLMRRVVMQKVLEALARTHSGAPDIAPTVNYMYADRVVYGGKANERRNDVFEVYSTMINADRQHRIITPLMHKYLLHVCPGGSEVDVHAGVSVFDEDMQPFVRQALTGKGCGDVFGFLDNPAVRTGYKEEEKFKLLVDRMFVSS